MKYQWTYIEDELIRKLRAEGAGWASISKKVNAMFGTSRRTAKQCAARWDTFLRPDVINTDFTREEEDTLIDQWIQYPGKWSQIILALPGRCANQAKNRFYSGVRRVIRYLNSKSSWPNGESMNLKQLLKLPEVVASLLRNPTLAIYRRARYSENRNPIFASDSPKDETATSAMVEYINQLFAPTLNDCSGPNDLEDLVPELDPII